MVKVLTMGKDLHYYGQNDLKQATVFYFKLQHMDNQNGQHKAASLCTHTDDPITNKTTDAFTEHVLTPRAHLPANGMARYALFRFQIYRI